MDKFLEIAIKEGVSPALIQAKYGIGYVKSKEVVRTLKYMGIISREPFDDTHYALLDKDNFIGAIEELIK